MKPPKNNTTQPASENKQTAVGGRSAPACSAVEVKNWTASDAKDSLMMMDQSGRRFHVTGIGWDGTVGVVAYDAIKPEDRDGWRLFVIQQNDKSDSL